MHEDLVITIYYCNENTFEGSIICMQYIVYKYKQDL